MPFEQENKQNPIYPDPDVNSAPDNTNKPPQNGVLTRRSNRLNKLILPGIISLLVIGLAAVALIISSSNESDSKANLAAGKVKGVRYYVLGDDYSGPYVYKYSGYMTLTGGPNPNLKYFVSNYYDGKNTDIWTRQPLKAEDNLCTLSEEMKQLYCADSYKTAGGRTVYPSKEGGSSFVEIGDYLLSIGGTNLKSSVDKLELDLFIDQLVPEEAAKIGEYDKNQRSKVAWQQIFSLPYQIYQPTLSPNGLPVKYQDITENEGLYGNSQRYLATQYTNKASVIGIDNTATTYIFRIDQLKKPSDFDPATNCAPAVKISECTEILHAVASPTSKTAVDTGKYHLYKNQKDRNSFLRTLIADYGDTIMIIEMYGPVKLPKEELLAAIIKSLNTMQPASLADLQFMSVGMSESL